MAAGVAPFVTSNPMNTVVAGAAEIDFNEYVGQMLPVAAAGSVVTFLVLRRIFRQELESAPPPGLRRRRLHGRRSSAGWWCSCWRVLAAYPAFALADLHVYVVAAAGAVVAMALAWGDGAGRPPEVLRTAVAWEILVFLVGMFLLAQGAAERGRRGAPRRTSTRTPAPR